MKPNSLWCLMCLQIKEKSSISMQAQPLSVASGVMQYQTLFFSSRVVQYIIIVIRFVSHCLIETSETQLYVIICLCGGLGSWERRTLSSERFSNNYSIFKLLTSTTIAHTMVWDLIKHAILKTLVHKVARCFCYRHEWNSSDLHWKRRRPGHI